MRHYLVVANQTLGGERLAAKLRELAAEGPCALHILVPATPPRDHAFRTEGEGLAVAERRLAAALERFASFGAEVTGEVGDPRPLDAIRDVLRRQRFDAIVLSTLPAGVSRWLRMDLPHQLERSTDIPIIHVEAEPDILP